jgi:hypothetical protein
VAVLLVDGLYGAPDPGVSIFGTPTGDPQGLTISNDASGNPTIINTSYGYWMFTVSLRFEFRGYWGTARFELEASPGRDPVAIAYGHGTSLNESYTVGLTGIVDGYADPQTSLHVYCDDPSVSVFVKQGYLQVANVGYRPT